MPQFKRFLLKLLLACFCCCSPTLYAQKLKFQQFGTEKGLPANELYNLHQDKKGYIWAFTEYGIVKHNGTRFVPVCKNLPFEESAVYVVRESPAGEMYIANSKAHIYKIRNDSAFLVKGIERASRECLAENGTVYDLAVDDSSNIYFSSFTRSYKLENRTKRLVSLLYKEDSVSVMYKKTAGGYFYMKTPCPAERENYVKVLDEQDKEMFRVLYPNRFIERHCLREKKGNYYLLSKLEIIRRDPAGKLSRFTFKEGSITMELAPNGHVWICTRKGLIELDAELKPLNYYFEDLIVSDVIFDKQAGMWVSTIERGIFYCKDIYTYYYDNIPGLGTGISVLKKIGNRLFIATAGGELFVKENELLRSIDLDGNNAYITDITFYNDQYLIGTKELVLTLNKRLELIDKGSFFAGTPACPLVNSYGFAEPPGDTLVYIAAAGLIKKYKNESRNAVYMGMSKTRSLLVRSNSEIFVGTMRGLFLYDGKLHVPSFLKALSEKRITTLKADHEKNIWICTKGAGLYILRPDNTLLKVKNIPADVVNSINFLNRQTVLLSTNKGLFIAGCNGQEITSPWRLLYDNEISSVEEYNGEVYIAAKQGLITLNRKRLFLPGFSSLYLESVSVNNRKIGLSNICLPYSENDIYFNFDVLEYEKQEPTFCYELVGPYSDRGQVAGTTLHLQNLQPGTYMLSVYLPDVNGLKNNLLYVPLCIRPAFWQTKLFLLEVIITVIALCVFLTGYFFRRQRKKQEQKTLITRLVIEQRLTALKAQINPHFISNSLAAIQQLMLENETHKVTSYIAKFSLLIRYTLNYSDKSAACLRNEIEIIDLNIELEKLRFSDKFIFEKRIGSEVNLHELFIPPLITQPLIENAIWHGLLPLKNHRIPTLILKIEIVEEKLIISVIDNGVGRKKNTLPAGTMRESKGVWLVTNRIKNLNRLNPQHISELRFSDLVNEKGEPSGTQVDLIFPLIVLDELYDQSNESYNH